jgi:hypothetical protein
MSLQAMLLAGLRAAGSEGVEKMTNEPGAHRVARNA